MVPPAHSGRGLVAEDRGSGESRTAGESWHRVPVRLRSVQSQEMAFHNTDLRQMWPWPLHTDHWPQTKGTIHSTGCTSQQHQGDKTMGTLAAAAAAGGATAPSMTS